jgi:hypothetical protein
MLRFCEHVSVIGCGGIGSWLLPPVLRFLNSQAFPGQICLWDGDHYSVSNLGRQSASERLIGRPKAEALAAQYRQEFPDLRVWHRNEFVTAENVAEAVPERSVIFSCVDNHPARALLARQAETRRDVCLISAGNERLDGNVCIMLRRCGKAVTASLLERHPEIVTAKRGDRSKWAAKNWPLLATRNCWSPTSWPLRRRLRLFTRSGRTDKPAGAGRRSFRRRSISTPASVP